MYIGPGFGVLVRDPSLRKKREGQWFHFSPSPPLTYDTEAVDVMGFGSSAGRPAGWSSGMAAGGGGAGSEGRPAGWQASVMLCCQFCCGVCPPRWASCTQAASCFMFAQYGD